MSTPASPMKFVTSRNPLALDPASDFQVVFAHPDAMHCELVKNALKYILHYTSHFRVVQDTFQNVDKFDCILCLGNSVGLLDTGANYDICSKFGWDIMQRVQQNIIDDFCGEQPVGTCQIVETGDSQHPWLAHSPVMYSPHSPDVDENKLYACIWAMLLAVRAHNISKRATPDKLIKTVLIPGPDLSFDKCAQQISFAWSNFINREHIYKYAQVAQAKRDPLTVEEEGYLLTCDFANRRHFIFSKDHLLEMQEDEKRTFRP